MKKVKYMTICVDACCVHSVKNSIQKVAEIDFEKAGSDVSASKG